MSEREDFSINRWRTSLPVGTPVTYWPGVKEGPGHESVTRSEVWRMSAGQLVVAVEGYAGGIALTHIERRRP